MLIISHIVQTLQNVTLVQQYNDDETSLIAAVPVFFNSGTSSEYIQTGGTTGHVDGSTRLYGQVERLYQLSDSISIHKFTRLTFFYAQLQAVQDFSVCIHENLDLASEDKCPSRCYSPKDGQNTISLGDIFNDEITSIGVIAFRQVLGVSEVRDLRIFNETAGSIFDADDLCIDPNAMRSGRKGCICLDGYSSSNGGKVQGLYDTCLSCLSPPEKCIFISNTAISPGDSLLQTESCAMVRILHCRYR